MWAVPVEAVLPKFWLATQLDYFDIQLARVRSPLFFGVSSLKYYVESSLVLMIFKTYMNLIDPHI